MLAFGCPKITGAGAAPSGVPGRDLAAFGPAAPVCRGDEVPHRHGDHRREAHVEELLGYGEAGDQHDGRSDHAEHAAVPLAVTEPAQRIGQQREPREQRQQHGDEQGLELAQEAEPEGSTEAGKGREAGAAAHRRDDAAQRAGLVGNARHDVHGGLLAAAAVQRLTVDG